MRRHGVEIDDNSRHLIEPEEPTDATARAIDVLRNLFAFGDQPHDGGAVDALLDGNLDEYLPKVGEIEDGDRLAARADGRFTDLAGVDGDLD